MWRGVEKLQWSAGNTPLLFFFPSLPLCSFSSPLSHSFLTHSPLPPSPSSLPPPHHCPCSVSRCLYMVRCIQSTFNPPGLSSGATLILSEAVSTTSLTPLYCSLPVLLMFQPFWKKKGRKNNALVRLRRRMTNKPFGACFIVRC